MTEVWAYRRLVGFHHWPLAPSHRAYLGVSHRHLFGVRVTLPVTHDDRDIEFHDLHEIIGEVWQEDWQGASCETIARILGQRIQKLGHGIQWIVVEVDEDQEAGARVHL